MPKLYALAKLLLIILLTYVSINQDLIKETIPTYKNEFSVHQIMAISIFIAGPKRVWSWCLIPNHFLYNDFCRRIAPLYNKRPQIFTYPDANKSSIKLLIFDVFLLVLAYWGGNLIGGLFARGIISLQASLAQLGLDTIRLFYAAGIEEVGKAIIFLALLEIGLPRIITVMIGVVLFGYAHTLGVSEVAGIASNPIFKTLVLASASIGGAYYFLKYRNLVAPVFAHFLYNLIVSTYNKSLG